MDNIKKLIKIKEDIDIVITALNDDVTPTNEPQTEHFKLQEYYGNKIVNGVKQHKKQKPPKELYPNIQQSMDMLELLRSRLGNKPIRILSGYRSPQYNAELYKQSQEHSGGVAKNSPHMRGTATDIRVQEKTTQEVYETANKLYIDGGVGLYIKDKFIHVDIDNISNEGNKRPARWMGE